MFNLVFESPEPPATVEGSVIALRVWMDSSRDGSSLANWYRSLNLNGTRRNVVVTTVDVIEVPVPGPFPRPWEGWQDATRWAADLDAYNTARIAAHLNATPTPPSRPLREARTYRVRVRGTAEVPDGAGGWTSTTWERVFRAPALRLDGEGLPANLATRAGDIVVMARAGAWRPAFVASA